MENKVIKEINPELDSELLDVLSEMENSNQDDAFVDTNKLFERFDFERASKVFEKAEKIANSKNVNTNTNQSNGLINEGYLRYLINSEIRKVFDDLSDNLSSQISSQLERTVAMMMQSVHREKTDLNG
jgi:Glu-tRNA(Gln) amidotransferase subunit E-like FAD-binding protein